MKIFIYACLAILMLPSMSAQELFNQSFDPDEIRHVLISNLSGPINVVKSSRNLIEISAVNRRIKHASDFTIDFKREKDYLMVYLQTPCTKSKDALKFNPDDPSHLNHWQDNCHWLQDSKDQIPSVQFEVRIPDGLLIYTSTIMDGDIEMEGISNQIWASNINGAIILSEVEKVSYAKTINGDIRIDYKSKPVVHSEFSTINGTIKIDVPTSLKATTTFKSFMGDFYTDFAMTNLLPSTITTKHKEEGFKYKVEDRKRIEINGGGTIMDFETFNGNVYLTSK